MATPPLGYSNLLIPESLQETYKYNIVDKSISICKSAIQQYLDSFLSPTGVNRNFLTSTISTEGLQYVTTLTYDEEMKTSPNLKKTHLARYFAENTAHTPSVMIIDQGVEAENSGINSLIEGFSFGNQWKGVVVFIGKVSLSINVATYSEEDTTTLSQLILYILDTLSDAVNNKVIHRRGEKWEVRLPMAGVTSGSMSSFAVSGDNKTQRWVRSIDLAVEIETHSTIKMPTPQLALPFIGSVGLLEGAPFPKVHNLVANQEIPVGSQYQLMITNLRKNHWLGTSDPNIVTVTSEPPWILQPRRVGKALLYIYDDLTDPSQDLITGRKRNLVLDIPFRVSR